jgi:hypothetical protein
MEMIGYYTCNRNMLAQRVENSLVPSSETFGPIGGRGGYVGSGKNCVEIKITAARQVIDRAVQEGKETATSEAFRRKSAIMNAASEQAPSSSIRSHKFCHDRDVVKTAPASST